MQRFAAKAGIGAVGLAIAAVAFLAGSAIEDGNAQGVPQAQISTKGIEWVNFTTGVDYNQHARDAAGANKQYFAEIHLLIPLSTPAIANQVDRYAEAGDTTKLRDLLIKQLIPVSPAADTARARLINALVLRD
jgi:hypothetical protein